MSETRVYRAALVGCSRMGAFIDNETRSSPARAILPFSHAAGYEACPRTHLIAGSDLRPDVLDAFGARYDVPASALYTDFRKMIVEQRPEILSVATQPEQRAEIALFAMEHGVRALYCEKALCASVDEARALVAAAERHNVVLNMGTNRRWDVAFDVAREVIASGEIGALTTIVIYGAGTLFNTTTHRIDAAMRLNGDSPVLWAQGHLPKGDTELQGDIIVEDPRAQGMFAFANGVMCHVLLSARNDDIEAICERGVIIARNTGTIFEMQRRATVDGEPTYEAVPFPEHLRVSATLRLIEDLVHALDTGEPVRGGARIAAANAELLFAFVESHRRGGVRVSLPLDGNTLRYARPNRPPRQPKIA